MAIRAPLRVLSLFSGGGGIERGVRLAVSHARVVCHVEREAFAAACLVAQMEAGAVAAAPVWSDVTTFDGGPWRGRVDLVAGGFPCQDISVAGLGAGLDGARSGLWREYARIVAEVGPRYVLIENVAALRSRGLDRVLADLAALGFDAEWGSFRAGDPSPGTVDVGASHRRERVFVLAAHPGRVADAVGERVRDEPGRGGGQNGARAPVARDARAVLADYDDGREGERVGGVRDSERTARGDDARPQGRCGPECGGADECPPWPPGPEDLDAWAEVLRVSPHLEPSVCRVAHGVAGALVDRVDRLRLLGNGVVPQVAAVAVRVLGRRLGVEGLP